MPLTAVYLQFWPSAVAAAVLAVAGLTPLLDRPRAWLVLSGFVITVALALYLPTLLKAYATPSNNLLPRDVVAAVVLAGAAPVLASWTAVRFGRGATRTWAFVLGPLTVAALCLAATPFLVGVVHCTSGDCL
jgi:hypothetical protein